MRGLVRPRRSRWSRDRYVEACRGRRLAHEGPAAARVGEPRRLADGVDPGALGVVRGVRPTPARLGRKVLHLRGLASIDSFTGLATVLRLPAPAESFAPSVTTNRPPATTRASSAAGPGDEVQPVPSATVALDHRGRRQGGRLGDRGRATPARVARSAGSVPVPSQKDVVARARRSSTRLGRSPSSRPISAFDRAARWVSSSTLRCWSGSRCRVSRTPFCSARDALLAVPEPGHVPALRHRPGALADPLLGVGQPADLAPVVAGGDECVAHCAVGRRTGLRSAHTPAGPAGGAWTGRSRRSRSGSGHDRPTIPACLTGLSAVLGQDGSAMTDLLSRPEDTRSSRPATGRPFARWFGGPAGDGEPEARPLTVSAALASLAAVATLHGCRDGRLGDRLVPGRRRCPWRDHRCSAASAPTSGWWGTVRG